MCLTVPCACLIVGALIERTNQMDDIPAFVAFNIIALMLALGIFGLAMLA